MTSSAVVVDSSTAIFLVLDNPLFEKAKACWTRWIQENRRVLAPHLWRYEVTTAIHKSSMRHEIEEQDALNALDKLLAIKIEFYEEDKDLCREAFLWASRLGQLATYDGFYLALAERNEADFWTANERLANRARQLGVQWVHWIGE
jgi:predicted nucleic acid-binding protein